MRVYVRLYGPLRIAAGSGEIELALSGDSATVAQALESICARYPQMRRYLSHSADTLPPGLRVLVADARLDDTTAFIAPLHDDDHLTLLMPVLGG